MQFWTPLHLLSSALQSNHGPPAMPRVFWDWVSYLSLFSALMRCHYRCVTLDGCNVASASRSCSARSSDGRTDGQIDDFAHGCGVTQILRQNCDDLCDPTILLGHCCNCWPCVSIGSCYAQNSYSLCIYQQYYVKQFNDTHVFT